MKRHCFTCDQMLLTWPVVDGLGFLIFVLYNLPIASTSELFLCSQALRKEKRSLGLSGGKEEEGVIRHFASLQYRMRVVFFLPVTTCCPEEK